jgi:transposase
MGNKKAASSVKKGSVEWIFNSHSNNHGGGAAMAKYNIGVDYHKKFSYLVVKDKAGQVLRSGQVNNSKASVEKFLGPFREDSAAVLESCRNWCVMHDWLENIVDEVVLANPYKVKAIAEAKIKTDKIDATVLADLLRADLVPQSYIATREVRDLRSLLRERMFFVRIRTMTKNRITTIFDRYPEEVQQMRAQSDLFGKSGRVQLEAIELREPDRALIDRELNFIDLVNVFIKEIEDVISDNFEENENAQFLKSIPGIGQFFAMLIDAEIGEVSRFRDAKKLASYIGIVPSTYSSGGKTVNGRITRQGSKLLRWAFIEAVLPAIRSNEELRFEYDELRKRMNYNKAKVAMARKIMNIAFKCLKDKRNFRKLNKIELERKKFRSVS